jgi:hypothetical protein
MCAGYVARITAAFMSNCHVTERPMLHLSPHTGSFLAAEIVAGAFFMIWAIALILLCIGLS